MRSDLDFFLTVGALLVAGILAMSSLILAKKPDAKQLLDKLVPYQGAVGVGLLVWGVFSLIRYVPHFSAFMRMSTIIGSVMLISILAMILLGILFGMPLIAKWIPGESPAEQKALQIQQKIGGFSVLIGVVGVGCAVALLLIRFGIIKY